MALSTQRILRVLAVLTGLCSLLAESAVTLQVPFIRQAREGCGSAAMAMVIEYWRDQMPSLSIRQADADRIQELLHAPEARGIYGSDMQAFLEKTGFHAFRLNATKTDLVQHLSRGRPIIVCLQPERGDPLHYVVVVGFDPATDAFRFNDPARGKLLTEDSKRFMEQWKRTENWALLAVPRGTR